MRNTIQNLWTRIVPALFVALAICLLGTTVSAQTFYGSIVGTVTDNSGAVVPGATVTITNLGTNEVRTAKTNAAGDYSFVNLVPASYKVAVQMASFKRFERQGAEVEVNTATRVDAKLQVGATTETVEVTTNAPLLQTESGSLGDEVQSKQVDAMPLNGRNTMNLMDLVPGVVPQGTTQTGVAMNQGTGTGSVAWGNYQIGGGMPTQSSIFIDGSPTMIMQKNSASLVPTADTIQEFQVQTSGVSPEFGRFGGGVVSMTTKSGGNQFHGTAYEYIRNKILNATPFFTNRAGLPKGQNNQNQFGGTVGGPIWKNKAFFFFAYEQIHIRQQATSSTNIPTAGMVNGSNIPEIWVGGALKNGNTADPIYTANHANGCNIQHTAGTAAAPGYFTIANLYTGTCGDPTTKIFASFYPTTPKNPTATSNWNVPYSQGDNGYQMSGRFDYDVTKNNRFFARFTLWPLNDVNPNIMGIVNPKYNTVGATSHNHTNNIVTGDTITLNPTTVLDIRADYLRQYGDSVAPSLGGVNESDFGSAFATLAPTMNYHVIPGFSFGGSQVHNLFGSGGSNGNWGYNGANKMLYNNYHLSASVTKMLSKHSLKFGVEARVLNREDVGNANSGNFTFNGDIDTGTGNGGDEWAQFLMGEFDSSSISSAKATTTYNHYLGFYAADTWQATTKLTLNYGIRMEAPGTYAEANNNAYVLLPTTADPVTGVTGTLGLVNSNNYTQKNVLNTVSPQWGPRAGFAYRLNSNTVVRGGYTLSYLPRDTQVGVFGAQMSINSTTSGCTNSAGAGNIPAYTVAVNPFIYPCNNPANPEGMAIAAGRNQTLDKNNFMYTNLAGGTAISGPYPYEPFPYSQGMNFSIGHTFKGETLVDLGFAHSLGTHLPSISKGMDQLPDTYDICGGAAYASAPQCNNTQFGTNLPTASKVTVTTPLGGVLLPNALQVYGQAQRPFPYYKNFSNNADYHGSSSYNALEVKVQKRFGAAGQIGGAYTWMKMITDTDSFLSSQDAGGEGVYQDYTNLKAERALYSSNAPHRLVINYILNLPFGQGQRFLANTNPIVSRAISGWTLSGITTLQSGMPLHLTTSGNKLSSVFGAGTIRPNYTAGCTKTNGGSGFSRSLAGSGSAATAKWFDTSCFTVPATPGDTTTTPGTSSFAFGNEPRVDGGLKASGVDNFDLSINKNTAIHDQIGLKFTLEAFNLFNRVQFAPPNTTTDNVNFGLVTSVQNFSRVMQASLRLSF
jgi:hypothetical protein